MPSFFRKISSKTTPSSSSQPATQSQSQSPDGAVSAQSPTLVTPIKTTQRREDAWTRNNLLPEDVQGLLHICTQELKSRALDIPFFLLPFRPNSTQHLSTVRAFIRRYFKDGTFQDSQFSSWSQEMKLLELAVLCAILRWCWSRLKGGVITWRTYELFKSGEKQSQMDKQAFDTFLPLSTESSAHRVIVLDFFDLLATIAANSRSNGFGGLKLSRYMGWFAFSHTANKGFEAGYRSWTTAADATSHMFFAYLRARAPTPGMGSDSIAQLPRSLVTLINETAYPPPKATLLESVAPRILMIVDSISPTPFVMLERARKLDYRAGDHVLHAFARYENPSKALSAECGRVLEMIASSMKPTKSATPTSPDIDASWTRFEDIGFSSLNQRADDTAVGGIHSRNTSTNTTSSPTHRNTSRQNQTWSDFMSTGFTDDYETSPPTLSLPAKQFIPVIHNDSLPRVDDSDNMSPGELINVEQLAFEETFWWVWLETLAPEEPADRKAVFGRCVLAELDITGSRWLVIEEQIRPAVKTVPEEVVSPSATSPEKKCPFFGSKMSRNFSSQRQVSSNNMQKANVTQQTAASSMDDNHHDTGYSSARSTPAMGESQQALIQAAAQQLVRTSATDPQQVTNQRRGRKDPNSDAKAVSVLSMQPVFVQNAGPALQWARKFDKEITQSRSDAQEKVAGSAIEDGPAGRTLLPAHPSKEEMTATEPQQASAGIAESGMVALEETTVSSAEDTSAKPDMVPSPLRIPKRKPVPNSPTPLSPGRVTSGTAQIDTSDTSTQNTTSVANDDTGATSSNGNIGLRKSSGSRRGFKNLFKRKVTDPTAKSATQREPSGAFERAVSGSIVNDQPRPSQQESRTVMRKRSLLRNKLEKATGSSNALVKDPAAATTTNPPAVASDPQQHERKTYGPEVPAEQDEETATGLGSSGDTTGIHTPASVPVVDDIFESRSATGQSAAFGAAQPGMLEDATNSVDPPTPAFSDFSDANTEQDRTITMSTVPEIRHARTETLQSMPAYALGFHPGTPHSAKKPSENQQNGAVGYQTRAAALLAPAAKATTSQPVSHGSSTLSQEPSTSSIASPTVTLYQTPLESSSAFPQDPLGSHPPTEPLSESASLGAQEEYDDSEPDSDGAPRPNTQERLVSASIHWAEMRQIAEQRRASQDQSNNTTPPTERVPPWQRQAPSNYQVYGVDEPSGFSPGGPGQLKFKGLGIAGIAAIEQEAQERPRVQEESIDDRVARIKARVAQLTGNTAQN